MSNIEDILSKSLLEIPNFYEEEFPLEWHMTRSERYCLMKLLDKIQPEVAIEIGTFMGGTAQVLSKYSNEVYSIDPNPRVKVELEKKFSNVKFLTEYSFNVIPDIFKKIEIEQKNIEFILIDGDHSTDSVRNDINLCMSYTPKKPLYIIFHDSFNPDCRKGIKTANYQENKHVHYVEIDFIPGCIPLNLKKEMWGGLALVVMLPTLRNRKLVIHESQKKLYDITYIHSKHFWTSWIKFYSNAIKYLNRIIKIFKARITNFYYFIRKGLSRMKKVIINQ